MAPLRSALSALLALLPASSLAVNLLVSHYNGNIYTLSFSGTSLKVDSNVKACGQMPSWLTLDYENKVVYCTDEGGASQGSNQLTALSVADNGALKVSATAKSNGGDLHSGLYGGANGKGFLATAEYDPSQISTFKLPLSGSSLQKMKFSMSGKGPRADRQDKPHPHSTFADPTGKFLVSADLGADVIRVFSIDASSGKLTDCPTTQAGSGDGPRHGAFWQPKAGSTDGTMLFVVNELGNSVGAYQVTYPSSGCMTLKKAQTVSTYAPGKTAPSNTKAAEVHVKGNFVYAVNRNDKTFGAKEDSVAMYSISDSGAIAFVEATNTHTYYPRTFSINKAGDMVAFGGQTSANVAIVARDPTTGKLGSMIASTQVGSAGTAGNEDGLSHVIWVE